MSRKFSIVITTYNRRPFLQLAISSALNQTLPCEVIVIDDGSNDDTQEYVRSLGNAVVYHRNRVNIGHAASVNIGVEKARGDWIKPLDDDDRLFPNCIEEMSKTIASFPEVAIASCQAIRVDRHQTELDSTLPVGCNEVFHVRQEDIHYQMLLDSLPFGTTAQVAFRKDAFLKAGGWNTQLSSRSCEEIDSWVRIAQYGDAVFINQPLSYRTLWFGNTVKKLSLEERLEANILLKQKIYPLVHSKYLNQLPEDKELQNFLKLHFTLVGLKNGSIIQSLQIVTRSLIFSTTAWKKLAREIWVKKVRPLSNKVINLNDSLSARLKKSEQLAIEYYHLATRSTLSDPETDRVVDILTEAESDRVLGLLIHEIDYVVIKELNFLTEDDPIYYDEQREKILAGILAEITVSQSSTDPNKGDRQLDRYQQGKKIFAFDYLREI